MNWLQRARSEIVGSVPQPTANTDETPVSAVSAVPHTAFSKNSGASPNEASLAEWWEERAAILEFDGGLRRHEAERQALADMVKRFRLPAGYRPH